MLGYILPYQQSKESVLELLERSFRRWWIRLNRFIKLESLKILNGLKIDQLGFTSLLENESKLNSWLWRYTLSQTELPLSMQQNNQPQNEPNSTIETQFNESNIFSNATLRAITEQENYKPGYEVSFVIPKNVMKSGFEVSLCLA